MSSAPHREDATAHADSLKEEEDPWSLDVYFVSESRVQRATLRSGSVNFEALGTDLKSTEDASRREFIDQLKRHFAKTDLDERLADAPAPKPFLVGGKGLPAILQEIDSRLEGVITTDLLSRLAMLSHL